MSKILTDSQWTSVSDPALADILIVNTCGFIEQARKESIDAILDLADHKAPVGRARYLVVTGCLSQRYARQITRQMPEVDAVLGTADYGRIADLIADLDAGRKDTALPGQPGSLDHLAVARIPSTPPGYAYIKVAEGCSNHCAYCAIPGIRGPFRSRPMPDLINEAERLAGTGYGEIILIAQDTGRYGLDLYGERKLPELLRQLCRIETVRQIRVLYTYSDGVTDELIEVMQQEPKIAHYLDMPVQHASDRILQLMKRRDRQSEIRTTLARLRQAMPDIILRSTVMVGYPGEQDEDFQTLLAFISEVRFDRLGCFIFSPEEGTAAWGLRPRVHYRTARYRYRQVMALQQQISAESNQARIGQTLPVTLESVDDRGIFYIGRSYGEAPEVDPVIYVAGTSDDLKPGVTCQVRLVDGDAYDMTGVTVS